METNSQNPDIEFKQYKIISKLLEKEEKEENGENALEINFPTIESFQKLCDAQIVKELLTLDSAKFSSFFSEENINLDKIASIKNVEMAKFLLIFLGFISSKNDIYTLYDEAVEAPEEENEIDNIKVKNYLIYLNLSIDYL